ncbi:hypothetical protein [Oricola sp.]|uniref:hypothetical protein n=1 Tax=Oricola sp. TaxID=1979950 RepID=UPI0025DA4A63|nr:hypothetical protein [Oricola sp.]MCI5076298.1 hypothetical protein [Oricola sp.]
MRPSNILPSLLTSFAFMCIGVSSGLAAPEIYLHLLADRPTSDRMVLQHESEDSDYNLRQHGDFAVTDILVTIESDRPDGLSKAGFEAMLDRSSIYLRIAARIDPADRIFDNMLVFSGVMYCQPVQESAEDKVQQPGFSCFSGYDEGDDGGFYLVPVFGEDGVAKRFDMHLNRLSQRVSDHEGTPTGDPFVGVLLDSYDDELDREVWYRWSSYANARPILRLADPSRPEVIEFQLQ